MRESILRTGWSTLALAAAVFATAAISILLTRDYTEIAAVWVANALILAAILRQDKQLWPLLLVGAYAANAAANIVTGNGWIIAVFCSAANSVEILTCAWVLTRKDSPQFEVGRSRDFLRLLLGAALGALLSATIATIALSFHNDVSVRETFVSWFVSDVLGLIVFTPSFAVLLSGAALEAVRGPLRELKAFALWSAFALGLALIFGQSRVDLLPTAPLLLIMIAFAFEASGVALAVALLSCVAIAATARGLGPESMVEGSVTYRLLHLQGFLALLVFSGMPAAIALSQRRRLQSSLATSETRLEAIAAAARDMIIRTLPDTTLTYVSPSSVSVLGYTPDELVGRQMHEFNHPEDASKIEQEIRAIFAAGPNAAPTHIRTRLRHKDGRWLWVEGCPRVVFDAETGAVEAIYDVVRNVTEQQAMAEAVHEARVRAEAAAQSKSEFLANMSHELRTPLNSVVGFARLLAQADDLSDRNKRFAALIEASSHATLSIVNDVLGVSAMERGTLALRPEPLALANLVESVRDMTAPAAEAKELAVRVEVDKSLAPRHIADSDRLRQVLLNLASNAVKFTKSGAVELGVARLREEQGVERVRFVVKDTGCGIAPEHHALIFERFAQLPAASGEAGVGTGLGLSIAESLVELMGGSISVESAPGAGSTFYFDLPLPIAGEALSPVTDAMRRTGPSARVLVVDDVDLNRELVQHMLEQDGHAVESAASGEEAIEKCAHTLFDLILMDVRMPGLDGLATTRLIRTGAGPSAQAPIVALTAGALPEQMRACFDSGMDGHVAKPVRQHELLAAVARWTDAHFEPSPGAATAPADLRRRFRERLFRERRTLRGWCDSNAPLALVQPLVHRIAGSAGSFGYLQIGERAHALNEAIARKQCDCGEMLNSLIAALDAELSADPPLPAA